MRHRARAGRPGGASLVILVAALSASLGAAGGTKFAAWGDIHTDTVFPLQVNILDPRQERQKVTFDQKGTALATTFASRHPGHLFIFGDEPDQSCIPPDTYATRFHDFVEAVRAVDASARFSPSGFAQVNDACGGSPHHIAYAQMFYDSYASRWGAPPVSEWRFHYFPDPRNLAPFFSAVNAAAAWAVGHGAPMVLGSFGFPGYPAIDVRPLMDEILPVLDADPRISGAIWWNFDRYRDGLKVVQWHGLAELDSQAKPRPLSADGEHFAAYATARVSPAGSGVSALADFNRDGKADYADLSTVGGTYYVHVNDGDGSGRASFQTSDWIVGRVNVGPEWTTLAADFTGDGLADLADVHRPTNTAYVHRNLGGQRGFDADVWAALQTTRGGDDFELLAGDFDGDGLADFAEHQLSTGLLWVRQTTGPRSPFPYLNGGANVGRTLVGPEWRTVVADFTGPDDGRRADVAEVNVQTGEFRVHRNEGGFDTLDTKGGFDTLDVVISSAAWVVARANGGAGWRTLFGDFTGDGFADYADLSTSTGEFTIHAFTGDRFSPSVWGVGYAAIRAEWRMLGQ